MKRFPGSVLLMITLLFGMQLSMPLGAQQIGTQQFPSRPIRMMVPAAAAGVTDIAARVLTARLSEALGQPVVVDNRAGAGGIIGTDIVAKAAPDGHTLMTAFDSFISNPFVFKKIPYDTLKDFAPVSLLIRGPQIFAASPKLGAKSFNEFVAIAKGKGLTVEFHSYGIEAKDREIARLQERKNELQKQFGKLACIVRMRRNIKQNALAKAVGSSAPTICNMETGFSAVSTELCRKIAEQLKKI